MSYYVRKDDIVARCAQWYSSQGYEIMNCGLDLAWKGYISKKNASQAPKLPPTKKFERQRFQEHFFHKFPMPATSRS
jgi:hypothetical protein